MLAEGQQDPFSFRAGAARTGNQAGFLLRETRGAWVFGGSDVLLAEQEKREVVDPLNCRLEMGTPPQAEAVAAAPFSIAAPTRLPHSVHEPS